ncbi:RNA polymerase sigma-70 factor [Chitinophaga sp. 212800010-3]|uniref:RNA polymerase sigma-70 factor n=1 Tax=unclassified Chitinophaga TaxID=2619133 RepID=UPI002DE3E68F|nr:RNA polymerase sigma-70 factor, ECF subfamily [Chitinophaga sp. 212800010-3]
MLPTIMWNYSELSDAELLLLVKNGEGNAFSEVYSRHFRPLYLYAYNILNNEEECCDAIQEIFVWLWENRTNLEIASLKGYLMASVKYRLARIIQTSKRRAEILASGTAPATFALIDDDIEVKELRRVINEFTETLPERAREIFRLSRLQHFSNKEIAARMGISEKTVENQITIALKKLRSDLSRKMISFLLM